MLGAAPVVFGTMLMASGCATPQDRCHEYVNAINFVMMQCGIGGTFDIVDARDPERIGCRWVASIDNPRELVRCVNLLNQLGNEMNCTAPELEMFPPDINGMSSLPNYCDSTFAVAAH